MYWGGLRFPLYPCPPNNCDQIEFFLIFIFMQSVIHQKSSSSFHHTNILKRRIVLYNSPFIVLYSLFIEQCFELFLCNFFFFKKKLCTAFKNVFVFHDDTFCFCITSIDNTLHFLINEPSNIFTI